MNDTADPIGDYLAALRLLEGVAGDVDVLVPGHGSIGGADQVHARIDQDRAYVHALRDARDGLAGDLVEGTEFDVVTLVQVDMVHAKPGEAVPEAARHGAGTEVEGPVAVPADFGGEYVPAIRDGEPEAAAQAACVHLDNTLQDYRREIQRRVFG